MSRAAKSFQIDLTEEQDLFQDSGYMNKVRHPRLPSLQVNTERDSNVRVAFQNSDLVEVNEDGDEIIDIRSDSNFPSSTIQTKNQFFSHHQDLELKAHTPSHIYGDLDQSNFLSIDGKFLEETRSRRVDTSASRSVSRASRLNKEDSCSDISQNRSFQPTLNKEKKKLLKSNEKLQR